MGGFNLRGLAGWGVVQQVKPYLSPCYCESLRIHPWWRRGRVKAHISKSKWGASSHPGKKIKNKTRLQAARPVVLIRKGKYLWLVLRLMTCLEHSAHCVDYDCTQASLKRTVVLVKDSQGPPASLMCTQQQPQKEQNNIRVTTFLKSSHYFKLKRILL